MQFKILTISLEKVSGRSGCFERRYLFDAKKHPVKPRTQSAKPKLPLTVGNIFRKNVDAKAVRLSFSKR